MTACKPLPTIAKCPGIACNAHEREICSEVVINPVSGKYSVRCACGWRGPERTSEHMAILAWNRRAPDADSEKRGAMAAVEWLKNWCESTTAGSMCFPDVMLAQAIGRGEVLPAKKGKKR